MNRLDKKQIFIGTILGIILSILTLILLTRNIQPLSAQQTTPQYMIFKTSREGFKFLKQNPIGGRQPAEYAPIFAQTPTTNSPGNQVVTKEYVDNNLKTDFRLLDFKKIQTTEVWTDHFIIIEPSIDTISLRIAFRGAGADLQLGKNCPLGIEFFDCSSAIVLLNDFESKILFNYNKIKYIIKSIAFRVTLRGRTGAFVVDFCKNFQANGAPDNKLYWRVTAFYDEGGYAPESDFANLYFAVDRAEGPGTAFIQAEGPFALFSPHGPSVPCDSSFYNYSR